MIRAGCEGCDAPSWDGGHRKLHPGAGLPVLTYVSLCAQEVDLGPEVTKEVVLEAEPSVETEVEAQPLVAMTNARKDSVGVEVAMLTDNLMPIIDQQQVLAR